MAPLSVFYLEKIFPHRWRHRAIVISNVILAILVALGAVSYVLETERVFFPILLGFAGVVFSFALGFFLIEQFFRSYYFAFDVAQFEFDRICYKSQHSRKPLVHLIAHTIVGHEFFLRAGASPKDIHEFLNRKSEFKVFSIDELILKEETLEALITELFNREEVFKEFLNGLGILKDVDVYTLMQWVTRNNRAKRDKEWWWSKDSLSRIQGIGRDWAYAITWKLDRYSKTISDSPGITRPKIFFAHKEEVDLLTSILNKNEQANAILVGPPGVGKKEIIRNLAFHVVTGEVPKKLQYRRVVLFNPSLLVTSAKTKGVLEEKLLEVLDDAERARNIILVVNNFPEFIKSAESLGADVTTLLEKYLHSKRLVVIGLSDDFGYHEVIEKNQELASYFERVPVEEPSEEALFRILQEEIQNFERRGDFLFTYSAIRVIAQNTKRYFPDGVLPDRAINLVRSVVSYARTNKIRYITEDNVNAEIHEQTQIPVGKIDENEKEKLLNLEDKIHQRVIGQDEAISAIANALRRARTDIQARQRPLGSFLFLGPTGVGKTETAKSLAHVFFGGEEHMRRLDMSEYKEDDAVERLIGSFDSQKSGTFANLLREHPYGVLLLDEFEKANTNVHDLFLQVLDEGFFSDMNGRKVNARNTIFIATSNAGSALIFDAVQKNRKLVDMKEEIIEKFIQENIFKPELLNRFDAVVLFHPLSQTHLEKIATILLQGLSERLQEQNIHLVINQPLVDAVVREGFDPKFGAREMRRAVQDKIENLIAQKIIAGEIASGEDLTLSPEELR